MRSAPLTYLLLAATLPPSLDLIGIEKGCNLIWQKAREICAAGGLGYRSQQQCS